MATLSASVPCSNGSVTENVTAPANVGTKTKRFVFHLSVQRTTKVKKAKAVKLTVAPGGVGRITPDAVSLVTDGVGYCAVVTSGGIDCWGDNSVGELGNGSEACSTKPVAVSNLSGIVGLASDASSYCAVTGSGAVECWGDNYYGELGVGTIAGPEIFGSGMLTAPCSTTPVTVTGLSDVSSLVSEGDGEPDGFGYGAILRSGGVDCWGEKSAGELGDGTTTESDVPVPVAGLTGVTGVTSDGDGRGDLFGYCAVLSSGGVDCWGDNSMGELGNGSSTGPDTCSGAACSTTPVAVTGLSDAVSVASDAEGYCAVLTSGDVDCWETTTRASSATEPLSLASDQDGMCALLTSDEVDCWGDNSAGELGDGTSTGPDTCNGSVCSTTPVEVTGLASPSSLGSDGSGYCAIVASGGVVCWGGNELGFLGIDSSTGPTLVATALVPRHRWESALQGRPA